MMQRTEQRVESDGTDGALAPGDLTHLGALLDMAPAVERRFEHDTRVERLAQLRIAIPFGLLFHNLHNFTTVVFMRDAVLVGVALRLALITGIGLIIWVVVPSLSARLREFLLCCGMLGVITVPVFLLWYSSDPNAVYTTSEYYLVLVFGGMILQLRFPYMMALTIVAVVEICIVFVVKPGLPAGTLGGFILQVMTGSGFTLYGNYHVELARRRSYLRTLREISRSEGLEADKTRLTTLSSSDPLTGLANRRAFDTALDEALAADSGDTVALLIVDIDHFKLFNDTYGHVEGDRCLRTVARSLAPPPWVDRSLVARYGGEEFAILLPGLDRPAAQRAGEAVRAAVEALSRDHAGRSDGTTIVTVSIGVSAAAAGVGTVPAMLLGDADAGLYAAKRLGRNRCVAGPDRARETHCTTAAA